MAGKQTFIWDAVIALDAVVRSGYDEIISVSVARSLPDDAVYVRSRALSHGNLSRNYGLRGKLRRNCNGMAAPIRPGLYRNVCRQHCRHYGGLDCRRSVRLVPVYTQRNLLERCLLRGPHRPYESKDSALKSKTALNFGGGVVCC